MAGAAAMGYVAAVNGWNPLGVWLGARAVDVGVSGVMETVTGEEFRTLTNRALGTVMDREFADLGEGLIDLAPDAVGVARMLKARRAGPNPTAPDVAPGNPAGKGAGVDPPAGGDELLRSGGPSKGELPFEGGIERAEDIFDPILSSLFKKQGAGDFQGIWLNRMKDTQFDDLYLAIYFRMNRHATGRVIGEEVQHAVDFAFGATRSRIERAAAMQGIHKEQIVAWWHRRVFTRQIQNIAEGRFGMGVLKSHVDDTFRAYQMVGGKLALQEILSRKFSGLF